MINDHFNLKLCSRWKVTLFGLTLALAATFAIAGVECGEHDDGTNCGDDPVETQVNDPTGINGGGAGTNIYGNGENSGWTDAVIAVDLKFIEGGSEIVLTNDVVSYYDLYQWDHAGYGFPEAVAYLNRMYDDRCGIHDERDQLIKCWYP